MFFPNMFAKLLLAFSSNNDYTAKENGNNADATVAYTSATSITVTGLSFEFFAIDIKSVKQIPTLGSSIIFKDTNLFVVSGSIGNQVITIANGNFDSNDTFEVVISGNLKGYDKTINALRVAEVTSKGELVIEARITSAPTGTASRYFEIGEDELYSIHFIKVGGTDSTILTIHSSNDPDTIDDTLKDYLDTTQYGHGVSNLSVTEASYTNKDVHTYLVSGDIAKTIKVDVEITGGTNDADYDLVVRKLKK